MYKKIVSSIILAGISGNLAVSAKTFENKKEEKIVFDALNKTNTTDDSRFLKSENLKALVGNLLAGGIAFALFLQFYRIRQKRVLDYLKLKQNKINEFERRLVAINNGISEIDAVISLYDKCISEGRFLLGSVMSESLNWLYVGRNALSNISDARDKLYEMGELTKQSYLGKVEGKFCSIIGLIHKAKAELNFSALDVKFNELSNMVTEKKRYLFREKVPEAASLYNSLYSEILDLQKIRELNVQFGRYYPTA